MCYQWELHPQTLGEERSISNFWNEQARSPDDNRAFFELLVRGVARQLPEIDAKIESVLENWKMARLGKVDLAVLRVAVFELLYSNDPEKPDGPVIVDEAVELSKRFGGGESSAFVNGILDALLKQVPAR